MRTAQRAANIEQNLEKKVENTNDDSAEKEVDGTVGNSDASD